MLIEHIDKYYQDKRKDREQKHFYITDTGKCQRAVYFSMKGYPKKEIEPKILRVFDRGDIIHQRLMSDFYGIPEIKVTASEIDIPTRDLFHGRADAIISIENKLYVVDIKSSNDFKFQKLGIPDLAHIKQIQLYMHYFEILQGILIYENKNTQDLKEFLVEYDSDFCKKIISEFEELKYQVENEIMPQKSKNLASWQCSYCDFKEECDRIERPRSNDK